MPNNSLIVECGEKSRYISYNDIYLTDVDYTTYSYVCSFDGEGAITSAIDYVISDELPKVYKLEGHGEAELPAEFQTQIEKGNMELESFSLLNMDEIPEDADALLIYAPESDISSEEATLLEDYLEADGKLLVIAGPTESGTLTNLYSVLESYGVEAANGLVVEADREHDAFQQPYILLPDIQSGDIAAYSSGANLDLAMNALSSLIGEREAVSIRSKSLSYNYLTISESAASMLKTWMIGVIPGAFVVYGVFTVIERRRRRHA